MVKGFELASSPSPSQLVLCPPQWWEHPFQLQYSTKVSLPVVVNFDEIATASDKIGPDSLNKEGFKVQLS